MLKKIIIICLFYCICIPKIEATISRHPPKLCLDKVLICGVCRDISHAVPNTIKNVEALGKHFIDYRAIIYENNSLDDTSILLSQWAKKNKKVVFITETLPSDLIPAFRTEKIARARNIVVDIAKKKKYKDFKYVILVDLDFMTDWPIDEIVKSINSPREWDCISANGLIWGDTYWDRYTYRNTDHPLGPELLGDSWWDETFQTWFSLKGKDWIPTYSAYGGLAIYKRDVITQFTFSGTVTPDSEWFYQQIIASLPQNDPHLQQYLALNGLDPNSDVTSLPIIFRPNTGIIPNYPYVTCIEFLPLYASMARRGYNKIYINPKMCMRY